MIPNVASKNFNPDKFFKEYDLFRDKYKTVTAGSDKEKEESLMTTYLFKINGPDIEVGQRTFTSITNTLLALYKMWKSDGK